jgi:hypothetical protein
MFVRQQYRVWVLAIPPRPDPPYCTQTHIPFLGPPLASYHREPGGTHIGYCAFIPSELAARWN